MIDPVNLKGTEVYDILEESWDFNIVSTLVAELETSAEFTEKYDVQLFYNMTSNGDSLQINIDTEYIFLIMEVFKDGSMSVYAGHDDDIMTSTSDWYDNISTIVKYFYLFCFNDIEIDDM